MTSDKNHKILLIDDEEANIRVLSISLRSDGYEVVTASNGEQGLEVFQKESPDIVLTDIKMPGLNGIQVLDRIKELDPESEVVIITGHGDYDTAIEALQLGASDFINKPIREEALSVALKRAQEKIAIRNKLKEYTENLEEKVQEATREVRRKSNFQIKLIRSSNDGIVATDEFFKIVIYNPEARRIFGHAPSEVIGKMRLADLYPPHLVQVIETAVSRTELRRDFPDEESTITSKTGETIPVRFSGSILQEKVKVMGTVTFFQDLREIKRLERELLRTERLAAVGQTVAGMAHCIKNILHGLKGGSYLMDVGVGKNDREKQKAGWQMIQRNIKFTSELVLDLLSYSKDREPEFGPCRPNVIAKDVCDLMMERAIQNHIEIKQDFDPLLDEVVMDPRTVHRVLLNLMTNAVDACLFDNDLTKHLAVVLKTVKENDRHIRFQVQDNGIGISEDVKRKLFTSFFSTKGARGTGLGLLVTRKLMEENNGSIDVTSQLGVGTSFTVRFPYQETTAD